MFVSVSGRLLFMGLGGFALSISQVRSISGFGAAPWVANMAHPFLFSSIYSGLVG